MYVKRLALDNLRGFEHLDFTFERQGGAYAGWTVITGDNASGKTALLKAIALALIGPDPAHSLQPSLNGWIRRGAEKAVIAAEIVASDVDRFAKGRRYEKPFWSELHIAGADEPQAVLKVGSEYKGKGLGPTHGPWAENTEGWFSAGYGPFRRLYGTSPSAQRVMSGPGAMARFATMFLEDATLRECELWIKDLHFRHLEQRERESSILEQVLRLLNDDFLRNGLRVEKVDSEAVWLRDSSGIELPLAEMSDGYRASLAMLADILRHIIHVYGHENLIRESNGRLVVPHPGVVLVDEIDSHLHPEWQRVIGFWFKERFPNIQFIVTTHSPIICQAADPNGIFHLPAPGSHLPPFALSDGDYRKIIKSKPDAIYVSPAFGMQHTRSPQAVAKRREYARLQAKQQAGCLSQSEAREVQMLGSWIDAEED